jgi:hypothetical protein
MNETSWRSNVSTAIRLLCAASIAAAAAAPTASLATCALPGCHGQSRSDAAAQASRIYGDSGGNALKRYSGSYRQSVSDSGELQTFATVVAGARNPYADDVARMGYARSSVYSAAGVGSGSSLRSARRADAAKSALNVLPGVQGLSVGIPGAAARLGR